MKPFFDEFYDKYHRDLFQFIYYMVKNRQAAEDLTQEVYIKVLQSYQSFDGRSSEKTWLFSIARHVAIDYFRKQGTKRKRIMDFFNWEEKGESLKDGEPLPDEVVELSDQMREVYKALDQCTLDQKSVIILRYIQGMSIQETADILQFSDSKVKTTQHRGMQALKKRLQAREVDDHEA
ncbi:RNA polymerase sigma factor SigX [Halobacillus shinanisalinarum]|uniref:RNA polymerase sigma factor n=1 Tax=Halobacillus shinanisalinarum TaxID=2932258 RepID=A0ABY4H0C6_9BACI|nr:RNA polymerase sigma factor SigX [Halobacillus shinanisalinarum]UOQ93618.1 RNA polymerase sigma factor SigX [Halobacillus shinanisalinarum]